MNVINPALPTEIHPKELEPSERQGAPIRSDNLVGFKVGDDLTDSRDILRILPVVDLVPLHQARCVSS